jgi:hypothetical protein
MTLSHLVLFLLKGHRADRARSMAGCCLWVHLAPDMADHNMHPLLIDTTKYSSLFNFTSAIMVPSLSSN